MNRLLKLLISLVKGTLMLTGLRSLWNKHLSLQPGLARCREIIGEMKEITQDSRERSQKLQKLLNK